MASAVRGAAAGLGATAAMTMVMGLLRPVTRGDLGPRQVTGWLLGRLDRTRVGQRAPLAPSLVNHAAYGSALGGLYGLLVAPNRARPRTGLAYGLVVWASNYGGLLPALGVLPTPPRDAPSHAFRVHAAHWVYGAVLGALHRSPQHHVPPQQHG